MGVLWGSPNTWVKPSEAEVISYPALEQPGWCSGRIQPSWLVCRMCRIGSWCMTMRLEEFGVNTRLGRAD